ncbi:DUF4157 domain-containing protein [Lysobacter yangpyeongensis]|uniref:DUF4157 domain-containing protein n=1 Tax=Lysobacter yangpyeongensis TaxID=346182 RepID=A0ABW0SJ46_9GAMM
MRALVAKPSAAVSWAHGPLQRKCSTCGTSHAKAECPKCKQQAANAASGTQDALEHEADRVADQVLKGANAASTGAAPTSIQRRANRAASPTPQVPNSVHRTLAESGRPLQPRVRRDMEHRFGHDFSSVRVHTGASADRSARDVDAQAYTVGRHVVFASGRFNPEQPEGRRLLAHELTHVVQQGHANPGGVLRYSPRGDHHAPAEREAERNAARIDQAGRLNVTVRYTGTPMLNRAPNSPGGCGVCMNPMLAGTLVHSLVGRKTGIMGIFHEEGGGAEAEFRISAPVPGARGGRLDMAVVRPREQTIYIGELKPNSAGGATSARADLAFYFALIASHPQWSNYFARLMKREHFTPRPLALKNPRLPACPVQTVTITNPQPGVYLYECTPHATTLEATPACKCRKQKKKKKKKSKKKQQKKKTRQQKKKTPTKQKAKPKAKKPKATKPKKPAKPKKPKAPKKKAPKKPASKKPSNQPKPKSAGGAANVGFGLSIFSVSGGAGNAGVGISVFSTSTSFGTAGASVSLFSDSIAGGAAAVSASADSSSATGLSVGATASKGSTSIGGATATAGTDDGSTTAAAATATQSNGKENVQAAAGVAGSGDAEGSIKAEAGSTTSGNTQGDQGAGSGDKSVDAKDLHGDKGSGTGKAQPSPAGKPGTGTGTGGTTSSSAKPGDKKGSGTGTGTGTGTGKTATPGTGTGSGQKTDTGQPGTGQAAGDATTQPGTGASSAGQQGQGTGPKSTGDLKSELADILGVLDPNSKPEDRQKAAEEAVKINEMLKTASAAQKALLAQLAQHNGNEYRVPASDWVDKILQATKGITEDDLKFLATLNWTPGHVTAEELRKRVLKALEDKKKPPSESKGDAKSTGKQPPTGEAGQGKGQGAGSGVGKGAGASSRKDEGSAPPGEGSKSGPDSGKFTVARPFKGDLKDVHERDYQFVVDKQITASTGKGAKPLMTLQWIGDDKKAYYYKLTYEVTEAPTEKKDDKKPNVTWLYFTLESTNTELIDIAPEGQAPFLIRPRRPAWYRVQKP